MWQLNLPAYKFRIINKSEKPFIFDNIRKKYVALTPEEWVRQNFIQYLITEKKYPSSYIAIEKQLKINGLNKRYDAVVFNRNFDPIIIIEFKAPTVTLQQSVFDQVATYNLKLNVGYFMVSNGLDHYCCMLDKTNSKYIFLNGVPDFDSFL